VEQRGIEHQATSASIVANGAESTAICATQDDSKPLEVLASQGPPGDVRGAPDAVETALAAALSRAAEAGRFDVVVQLVRELEARRRAKARDSPRC